MKTLNAHILEKLMSYIPLRKNSTYAIIEPNEDVLHFRTEDEMKEWADEDEAVKEALKLKVGESFYDSEVIYIRMK